MTGGPAGGRAADGHPADRPPVLALPAVPDWIRESGRLLFERWLDVASQTA